MGFVMIDRHSSTAHAAYNDLLRSLLDDTVSDIRGTPTKVERANRIYWYDTYRVGADVRKRYIGEDSESLRSRLKRHSDLKEQASDRQKNRARLIRILRAERFLGLDATTSSLLRALASAGVFRLGGTVVGTNAFRLYEGELGVRFTFDQMAQTNDIDIASFEHLSLALGETISPPLEDVLADFSFDPVPSLHSDKVWRWKQTKNDMLVEFLTPSFDADEGLRHLAALGVEAQSLHHLNYLIGEPINAAILYRDGVLVQAPRPERFAIHKLIVADRRREGPDALKARKDRLQAEFLIEVLAEDRPDDLKDAYEDALSRGPTWRTRLERSLQSSPEVHERLAAL
jgi:hypothetical protein